MCLFLCVNPFSDASTQPPALDLATIRKCLESITVALVAASAQCAKSFPSPSLSSTIRQSASELRSLWRMSRPHQTALNDTFFPDVANIIADLDMCRILLAFLGVFQPLLEDHRSRDRIQISRGSGNKSKTSKDIVHDRAAASCKALRSLRERRMRVDPFPFDLTTALECTMELLTFLFLLDGARAPIGGVIILMLDVTVSEFLRQAMQYMLRCNRALTNTEQGSNADCSPGTSIRDVIVRVCVPSCLLLLKISQQPSADQVNLMNGLHGDFLDVLCCLAMEGLANAVLLLMDAKRILITIATFNAVASQQSMQETPKDHILQGWLDSMTQSLCSSAMLRMVGTALQIFGPTVELQDLEVVHNLSASEFFKYASMTISSEDPESGCSKSESDRQTLLILNMVCMFHRTLLHRGRVIASGRDIHSMSAVECHALLVEAAASSSTLQGSCGVTVPLRFSSALALENGGSGLADLVTALSHIAGQCAAHARILLSPAELAANCLALAVDLIYLARRESQQVSIPKARELHMCLLKTAHLAAAAATVLDYEHKHAAAPCPQQQVQHDASQLAAGVARCRKVEASSGQTEDEKLKDALATLVFDMLEMCETQVHTSSEPDCSKGRVRVGECDTLNIGYM